MQQKAHPLFLQCETGLHAGSGSELGIIDLPIQRERHTDFPKIEGSSLKGSIREHFTHRSKNEDEKKITATFGSDPNTVGDSSQAGAIGITDARLLLFPVKSMKGVFAYITCPRVIHKFIHDLNLCEGDLNKDLEQVKPLTCIAGNELTLRSGQVVLEQYTYQLREAPEVQKLGTWLAQKLYGNDETYWSKKLQKDIIILPDDDFRDFVMLSTEVVTRIKIDNETGTVAKGALFTEEYLPAESILYSLILTRGEYHTTETFKKKETNERFDERTIRSFFANQIKSDNIFQLGGNATLGKGILRATFLNKN